MNLFKKKEEKFRVDEIEQANDIFTFYGMRRIYNITSDNIYFHVYLAFTEDVKELNYSEEQDKLKEAQKYLLENYDVSKGRISLYYKGSLLIGVDVVSYSVDEFIKLYSLMNDYIIPDYNLNKIYNQQVEKITTWKQAQLYMKQQKINAEESKIEYSNQLEKNEELYNKRDNLNNTCIEYEKTIQEKRTDLHQNNDKIIVMRKEKEKLEDQINQQKKTIAMLEVTLEEKLEAIKQVNEKLENVNTGQAMQKYEEYKKYTNEECNELLSMIEIKSKVLKYSIQNIGKEFSDVRIWYLMYKLGFVNQSALNKSGFQEVIEKLKHEEYSEQLFNDLYSCRNLNDVINRFKEE